MSRQTRNLARFMIGAYLSIIAALVLIVGMAVWSAYRDLEVVRVTLLQTEVSRLHAQAVRTVAQLEAAIEHRGNQTDLALAGSEGWFDRHTQAIFPRDGQEMYSAVVDRSGRIVLHTDPTRVGEKLSRHWYEQVVPEAGKDVVFTRAAPLTGGVRAYDLRLNIDRGEEEVGELHVGFDANWFDQWVNQTRSDVLAHRLPLLIGTLVVVGLASVSLWYLGSHSRALREAIVLARLEHESELGLLVAGLAHEIRNPLHAIRLNLHALRRSHDGLEMDRAEVLALIRESNREIDQIDGLMRELLGFATPERPSEKSIDVVGEVDATLSFLKQEFVRADINVVTHYPSGPAWVRMDPGRLRQVLLNLFINAQEAVKKSGTVSVEVERRAGAVNIAVQDDGPGIPPDELDRLFEPFYSTRSDGCGLGLTLTRRFVEEAHGTVRCEEPNGHGARFVVSLPEQQRQRNR